MRLVKTLLENSCESALEQSERLVDNIDNETLPPEVKLPGSDTAFALKLVYVLSLVSKVVQSL